MAQTDHSPLWRAYIESASEEQQRGRLSSAEKILSDALKEAEERAELDKLLVNEAHRLGELYCMQRDYTSAERVYRMVLEAREKMLGSDHPAVVDSLERMALVLREAGRKAEAGFFGYRALSLRAKALSA